MLVFRLGSSRYSANDGRGASLYGGRWNHKGTAVIYTAESKALCALEVMANADELGSDYVITTIEMPDETQIMRLTIGDLPIGWDAGEPPSATRNIGTQWARNLSTPVLQVPSAVVPRESNFILNPAHPKFGGFCFSAPEPFYFDDRLSRAWRVKQ